MNYKNLNIYELRNYARQVGVRAPTSLRVNELCSEIEKIENGEKAPYRKSSGRPAKNWFDVHNKNTKQISEIAHEIIVLQKELSRNYSVLIRLLNDSANQTGKNCS